MNANTPKIDVETQEIEEISQYFDTFLEAMITQSSLKMSDNVKLINASFFRNFSKYKGDSEFQQNLGKNYSLKRVVPPTLAAGFIQGNKRDIEAGKILLFPKFVPSENGEFKVEVILFIEKKDTLGGMKQRVKRALEGLLGESGIFAPSNN